MVVQHDDLGGVGLDLLGRELDEGHDRQAVSHLAKMCHGTIQNDAFTATRGLNRVGLEAVAILLVADEDFLIWHDSGLLEELLIDRHAALVVHVRIGHDGPVDFGTKNCFEHQSSEKN